MHSSKRHRSPSKTPSSKRQRSLPVFELLLGTDTMLELISDNSTYSFVFYGEVKGSPGCFKLNGLSFNQFCMKISLVGPDTTVYDYTTLDNKTISKYISTEQAIEKEVHLQRRLDDKFRKNGKRPIVPYVIHECLLSSIYFKELFPESKTLQSNVRRVIDSIQREMTTATTRKVHMFFMEYMDSPRYKTLTQRNSEWDARLVSPVRQDYKKKAYQRMAANLACAAGCEVIPYDAYEPNVMLDYYADDVRLIDLGNTFDLLSDKDDIVRLFDKMLTRINKVGGGDSLGKLPTLDQLNLFFGGNPDSTLSDKFNTSLEFVNLQIEGNLTVEHIHRNLIMLAFIDFMINRFGLLDMMAMSYCKCRFTLESVYGEGIFADFGAFLTTFRPHLISDTQRSGLTTIMGLIQQILTNQPPARQSSRLPCSIQGGGSNPTFIKRYLPDTLSKRDKTRQSKELTKSRKLYKQRKYYTRKTMRSFKSKPSKHLVRARTMYNIDNIRPSRELSRKSGCSLKGLRQIVKKGEGAYYSSGSRPNQTPQSWGYARLASTITGGNASAVDFHILDKECDHHKPAYRLAQKPPASS